jgi:nicotinate-nucleotide pyrophosphorylase (carboxylating)
MSYVRGPKIENIIEQALKEDIGRKDITTQIFIPEKRFMKAIILAKEPGVACGLGIAALVFRIKDRNLKFKPLVKDGQKIKKNKVLAIITGRARSILTAERVALNFLSLLCAVATKTRKFVEAVKPYKVKIVDTRKTIPGLRSLEKYAVRIGGGYNHRFKLDEMIMVKDNHLKIQNPKSKIQNLIKNREKIARGIKIEIEVKNLKEFKQALKLKPDIIMLDNMSIKDTKKAVRIKNNSRLQAPGSRLKLEASGSINLKNVKKVASCGVDMISVGALTHSLDSLDISLEIL